MHTNKRFSRNIEDFTCANCGAIVKGKGYTDHCNCCLWSMHVDMNPGDRMSECRGMMEPVKSMHDRNTFIILYTCTACGIRKKTDAAPDDNRDALFGLLA
ncbi:MAG: RNHCP domain-containing protein [Candidatus Micrarchaeaceae archaeon]